MGSPTFPMMLLTTNGGVEIARKTDFGMFLQSSPVNDEFAKA